MVRTQFIRLLTVCIITICAVYTRPANAQDVEPAVIIAAADRVTLPESWVSGINTITLQNDTEVAFSPMLARFINGATMEDFTAAMMAQDIVGMLETISALGSVSVEPGESLSVTYDFLAGDYLFLNFDPAGPPTLLPFTVVENEGEVVEAPVADVEIVMVDFAFGIPVDLMTGDAVWHFSNQGEQTHEIVIFSVDDDATVESVSSAVMDAMMAAEPGVAPELPFEPVFSFIGISPGENAWMTVNLQPGTYAALCFIPDATSEDAAPHLTHGMITIFTVAA